MEVAYLGLGYNPMIELSKISDPSLFSGMKKKINKNHILFKRDGD